MTKKKTSTLFKISTVIVLIGFLMSSAPILKAEDLTTQQQSEASNKIIETTSFREDTQTLSANEDKLNICHQTNSEKNPWNVIQVNDNTLSTHLEHGDFTYEGPLKDNGKPDNKDDADTIWCGENIPEGTDDNDNDDTATIMAHKVICPTEDLLPNWHNGADVTEDTLSEFLDDHPTCHEADWTFEWAPAGTPAPLDNAVTGGNDWTSFEDSVEVEAGSDIYVREQVDSDYVPFSGNYSINTSAAIYCHTDVTSYDNLDAVMDTEAGETYHCIAFNAESLGDTDEEGDICANLPGTQTEVPDGKILMDGGFCVSEPETSPIIPQINSCGSLITPEYAIVGEQTDPNTYDYIEREAEQNPTAGDFIDHHWVHTMPDRLVWDMGTATSSVYFIPSVDHGPFPEEAHEATLYGSNSPSGPWNVAGTESIIYPNGPTSWISDDDSALWTFDQPYRYISLTPSYDGDAEIDAICHTMDNQCLDDTSSMTIYSDATTVTGGDASLALAAHPGWGASIPGATWIWDEDMTNATVNQSGTFTKTFNISGTPTDSELMIAADNTYSVAINGEDLCESTDGDNFSSVDTCAIDAELLNSGSNTLVITVTNQGVPGSTLDNNPGGLLYKLTVNQNSCDSQESPDDLCSNISGLQNEIPSGMEVVDGQCLDVQELPNQCLDDGTDRNVIYSDTTTTYSGNPTVIVPTPYNPRWTATIPGANWIWSEHPMSDNVNEVNKTFRKTFNIVGTPTGGELKITSDNTYVVRLNGDVLCQDSEETNYFNVDTCVIDEDMLVEGQNTLEFDIKNLAMANGTQATNPAGLMYKLVIEDDQCINEVPEPTQCSDNMDNSDPEDSLADELDPGCWTDPNNSNTYNPNDNDETNPTDMCTNITGFQLAIPADFHQVNGTECEPDTSEMPTQCSDNIDNADSEDSLIDENDPGCHSDGNASNSESYNPNDNDETNSDGIGGSEDNDDNDSNGRSHRGSSGSSRVNRGEVLGAQTFCGIYIDKYLRKGYAKNNPEAVTLLQEFLNDEIDADLEVNGIYDDATEAAVMEFQAKYSADILLPWQINASTGIFYLTTLRMANMLKCPDLALPIPALINWSLNPNL